MIIPNLPKRMETLRSVDLGESLKLFQGEVVISLDDTGPDIYHHVYHDTRCKYRITLSTRKFQLKFRTVDVNYHFYNNKFTGLGLTRDGHCSLGSQEIGVCSRERFEPFKGDVKLGYLIKACQLGLPYNIDDLDLVRVAEDYAIENPIQKSGAECL